MRAKKQHEHEIVVKKQLSAKMDARNQWHPSNPHKHFGYDVDANYKDDDHGDFDEYDIGS